MTGDKSDGHSAGLPDTPAMRRTSRALRRRAAFIDRDGTLIVDKNYLKDAAQVELVPHAANAVRAFNYALVPVIVISNQSGIARGLLTEADYRAQRARLDDLLEERSAFVDDHYHCPHHPEVTGACECRKPGIGMYEQAIVEHQLDAAASFFIGDKLRDVLPARRYGGRGILVPSPETSSDDVEAALAAGFDVVTSLSLAAALALDLPHPPES
ncbi:MAG: HAD family hydrolase [Gemmatimonadetes bacterium]|nr:HAD family hydrolase [Gemmatimonadota bacterium]